MDRPDLLSHSVLYLASTSPRRRSLLAAAGIDHASIPPGQEPVGAGTPKELARCRARAKAGVDPRSLPAQQRSVLILAVDTVVDLDGREFGKPVDRTGARAILRALAGREHSVHTALCLQRLRTDACQPVVEERWEDLATARVCCDPLSEAQLETYLEGEDWQGKAGAYGIQGEAGRFMHLRCGDLDTVIGLPVSPLSAMLALAGCGCAQEPACERD